MHLRAFVLVLSFLLLMVPAAEAARPQQSVGYSCKFRTGTYGLFKNGSVSTRTDKKFLGAENEVVIDQINPNLLTARISQGASSGNAGVFKTSEFMTFVQRTENGGITFTTVYPRAMDGRIYAVQSQHHARIGVEPRPAQGYGLCEELMSE